MSTDPETAIVKARETVDAAYLVILRHVDDVDAQRLLLALRDEHLASLDTIVEMRRAVAQSHAEILASLRAEPQSIRAELAEIAQRPEKIIRLPAPR